MNKFAVLMMMIVWVLDEKMLGRMRETANEEGPTDEVEGTRSFVQMVECTRNTVLECHQSQLIHSSRLSRQRRRG